MSDAVDIKYAPNLAPASLRLDRNGDAIKAKWGVPVDALWEDNNRRWTGIDIYIYCNASKNMARSGWTQSRDNSRYVTGDRIWVRDLGIAHEHEQPFDRNAYHPKRDGRYLYDMSWDVWPFNGKGQIHARATYKFYTPRTPTISDLTFDVSTGKVTGTIKTDAGTDAYDRYDTAYRVIRQDNFNRSYASAQPIEDEEHHKGWTSTTETEKTITVDVPDHASAQGTPGRWIKITIEAYARGVRGNSSIASNTYVISHPPVASIKGVRVSSLSAGGIVTVLLSTNATANNPVDTVSLERCITPIPTAAGVDASQTVTWTTDIATDNGNCQGLVDSVAAALPPNRNNYTYYRLKTVRGTATVYSLAYQATALKRGALPSGDDVVAISAITSGTDGTSLHVKVAWQDDDSNGTEISWSENSDAWESTEQPSTYNITWEDATAEVPNYSHSASLVIRGLTMGTKYYVKARRFLDDGSEITYADNYGKPPDEIYPIAPYVLPSNVVLEVPAYLKRGEDLEAVWRFDSEIVPTGWILYRHLANNTKVVVDSGEDAFQASIISSDVIRQMLEDINYSDDKLTFSVSITVGSDWVDSVPASVTVLDPPSITVATSGVLAIQPMQFVIRSSEASSYVTYKVLSRGVTTQLPDKMVNQVEDDVVYSEKVTPIWYPSNTDYYATITLPENLAFYDGASYQLQAAVTSTITGLTSETGTSNFEVVWLHQARRPGYGTTVEPDFETLSVTITPDYPENYQDTDVLDIYRLSPEGSVKVAESLPFGCVVTDRYAPFTKRDSSAYRLVTRTKDGDMQWTDVYYDLKGYQMRFDWGDSGYLELPYNIEVKSSYTKDYEGRSHIDGSITGFWNEAVSHSDSLTTRVIRLSDPDTIYRAIELGRYPGPVFVRLPNGSAYTANVVLSNMQDTYNTTTMNVQLKADEIGMVDRYKIAPENVVYPDGFMPPEDEDYQRKQILLWGEDAPLPSDTYTLTETPDDEIKVELTSSYDYYANPWEIEATRVGNIVQLGAFSQDLLDYIDSVPESTQFLLQAYYNV